MGLSMEKQYVDRWIILIRFAINDELPTHFVFVQLVRYKSKQCALILKTYWCQHILASEKNMNRNHTQQSLWLFLTFTVQQPQSKNKRKSNAAHGIWFIYLEFSIFALKSYTNKTIDVIIVDFDKSNDANFPVRLLRKFLFALLFKHAPYLMTSS